MSEIDDIVILLRRGNQHAAFERLRVYLTQHPDDALAWFWLSEATPLVSRKVEALRRFLALAPDHPRSAAVRARLGYLEAQLAAAPPEPKPQVAITYEEEEQRDDTSLATAPQVEVRPDTAPQPPIEPPVVAPVAETPPAPTPEPSVPVASRTSSITVPEGLTPIEPSRMPSTYRLSTLGTGIHKKPATDTGEEPTASHPAVPTLLQSLLDTAPMPEQRPDTITLPEARPYPPAPQERRASTVAPTPVEPPQVVPSDPAEPDPVAAVSTTSPTVAPPQSSLPTHTEVPAQPPITVIIQERMPAWAWVLAFLMVVQIGLQAYLIFTIQLMIAALAQ